MCSCTTGDKILITQNKNGKKVMVKIFNDQITELKKTNKLLTEILENLRLR